uniref:Uncharacterized protein n=1 Tax=Oryza punctata TaxID=4537 RepID=A0A0E0KDB3_ORYPU
MEKEWKKGSERIAIPNSPSRTYTTETSPSGNVTEVAGGGVGSTWRAPGALAVQLGASSMRWTHTLTGGGRVACIRPSPPRSLPNSLA